MLKQRSTKMLMVLLSRLLSKLRWVSTHAFEVLDFTHTLVVSILFNVGESALLVNWLPAD